MEKWKFTNWVITSGLLFHKNLYILWVQKLYFHWTLYILTFAEWIKPFSLLLRGTELDGTRISDFQINANFSKNRSNMHACVCAQSCSTLHTPWFLFLAHLAPLSVELSKQEYWRGCHFHLQGISQTQGSHSCLLWLRHWQVDSLPVSHLEAQKLIY